MVAVAYLVPATAFVTWNEVGAATSNQELPLATLRTFDTATSLPSEVGVWQRRSFHPEARRAGSAFGEQSRVWQYQGTRHAALFSLDYPFPSWHDLTRCYTGQGWRIEDQEIVPVDEESAVCVRLSKPAYRSGYLLFTLIDTTGRPLEPRLGGAYVALHRHGTTLEQVRQRLRGEAPGPTEGTAYQLQLFVESSTPLSLEEETEARALFARLVGEVRGKWSATAR